MAITIDQLKKRPTSNYWKKRMELLEAAQLKKGQAYFATLEKQFKEASANIEKEIAVWYQRFAINNNISMAEAKQLLNTKELAEFRWDVKEYIKHGEENALNQQWMKELENASARVHISRLEALKLQMQQQVEVLYGNHTDGLDKLLRDIYSDGYYHTAFEIQKGFNIGWDLQDLNSNQLDKVLSKPWTTDGKTFSDRIWTNKQQLIGSLQTHLTQAVIRGQAPDKAIKSIAEEFRVSKNKAGRLVMTESAAFASASQRDAFNALDVERFEIVATLDNRTSQICQDLDGHVFDMKDFEVGVTAPPFHAWCRTTTVPYFDDNYGERAARGADGKVYYVPSNMKYADWKKTFVDGGSKDGLKKVPEGLRKEMLEHIRQTGKFEVFPEKMRTKIYETLENAPDEMLKIFNATIDNAKISVSDYGISHYNKYNGITMNIDLDDLEDEVGVFFHEYGHYVDDTERNGLHLITKVGDERYSFDVESLTSRANYKYNWKDEARKSDLQSFLNKIAPNKYKVSDEGSGFLLKESDELVGMTWGKSSERTMELQKEVNEYFEKLLGKNEWSNFLISKGYPQQPNWGDYFKVYITPKKKIIKSKEIFKGASDKYQEAMLKFYEAREAFESTHDMKALFEEQNRLYEVYCKNQKLFKPISDSIDGAAYGQFGNVVLWGGHSAEYYAINDNGISEAFANYYQVLMQNDSQVLNWYKNICPETAKVFDKCLEDLLGVVK